MGWRGKTETAHANKMYSVEMGHACPLSFQIDILENKMNIMKRVRVKLGCIFFNKVNNWRNICLFIL